MSATDRSIQRGSLPPAQPETLAVTIRVCAQEDVDALEWDGVAVDDRDVILEAFARQQQRFIVMLVAEMDKRIVGQVWIDLTKLASRGAGFLWALRVHPSVRCRGIGTELIGAAEAWLTAHAFDSGAVGVEKDNARGMILYRRLGYEIAGELLERYTYTTAAGEPHDITVDQWLLEKRLLTSGVRQ